MSVPALSESLRAELSNALRATDLTSPPAVDAAVEVCRRIVTARPDSSFDQPVPLVALHGACDLFERVHRLNPYVVLLPKVRDNALYALQDKFNILRNDKNQNQILSRLPHLLDEGRVDIPLDQCLGVLSLAFFCALPLSSSSTSSTGADNPSSSVPHPFRTLDLYRLMQRTAALSHRDPDPVAQARLACLLEYFSQSDTVTHSADQNLTIIRRRLPDAVSSCNKSWADCIDCLSSFSSTSSNDLPVLQSIDVTLSDTHIEDSPFHADAHVDFANKCLHIGRVAASATQEEVLFSLRPDLLVAMPVVCAAPMREDEVLVMTGARRFSSYSGDLSTFRYTGPYFEQKTPAIVALDATVVLTSHCTSQYSERACARDFLKCWLGFLPTTPFNKDAKWSISTGQWGCGLFGGDPVLKFVQQWAAASCTNSHLVFSTYGNNALRETLTRLVHHLDGCPIAKVARMVSAFSRRCQSLMAVLCRQSLDQFLISQRIA